MNWSVTQQDHTLSELRLHQETIAQRLTFLKVPSYEHSLWRKLFAKYVLVYRLNSVELETTVRASLESYFGKSGIQLGSRIFGFQRLIGFGCQGYGANRMKH